MKLLGYPGSSASFRVRMALNLKGVPYESVMVDITKNSGEQLQPEFQAINPQALVPVLEVNGHYINQSLAILEYLEEEHPMPPLLPSVPVERARVRGLALQIACEVHPVTSQKVIGPLKNRFALNEDQTKSWVLHFLARGLGQFELRLHGNKYTADFCHGETPTIADCFLIPQVFNAKKMGIDIAQYPCIERIYASCMSIDAVQKAMP